MPQHSQNHRAGYFQGILQLRNPTPELIGWVEHTVKKDNKASITFSTSVAGGVDMYFSSQTYLRAIGKKIAARFIGELKSSRKLWTLDKVTSKEIYRVYVMFKLPKFFRGSEFVAEGVRYKILQMAKYINVQNMATGKKENWDRETVDKYMVYD